MSEKIIYENVVSYYNEHTKNKLGDYITVSPRIEEAFKTLVNNVKINPENILEVGCGVGSICHKMNRKWPQATITGIDISTESISIANKLFANEKVNFLVSLLTPETFNQKFDLIIFMDVYEHIAVEDRKTVHSALKTILNDKGKIFLSVPTPHNLKWSLVNKPETMQPVDEHISYEVIGKLAIDTETEVRNYQIKDIWNEGDYAHAVLEKNDDFESYFFKPKKVNSTEKLKRILAKINYLVTKPVRLLRIKQKLK